MRISSPISAISLPPVHSFQDEWGELRKLQHHYVVGSRVHCRLIGSGDGIVFAIHGEQRPETVRFEGIAVMGGNAEFGVVFANGHILPKVSEAIIRCEQWDLLPGVAGVAEIADALRHAEAVREQKAANAAQQAAELERRRLALIAEHGHWLRPLVPGKPTRVVQGADNLREELARAFPEVRFSVRSRGGVMKDCIVVTWRGEPASTEVGVFADKYAMQRWDPKLQESVLIPDNAWAAAFGGAHFISLNHYGDTPAQVVAA